ncbi:hypothetical protein [Devosia sp.]|uniref:hypothetical protein n=1 Tax=Devosia sp. TaxID=1871048 RepID=UPI00326724E0
MADESSKIEWSARHTRVRAELFVTAVLIYLSAYAELKLEKIPVLGIEIVSFDGRLLALVLYVFFVYLLAAVIVLSLIENVEHSSPYAEFTAILDEMRSRAEKNGRIANLSPLSYQTAVSERLELLNTQLGSLLLQGRKAINERLRAMSGEALPDPQENPEGRLLELSVKSAQGELSRLASEMLSAYKTIKETNDDYWREIDQRVLSLQIKLQKIERSLSWHKGLISLDLSILSLVLPVGCSVVIVLVALGHSLCFY